MKMYGFLSLMLGAAFVLTTCTGTPSGAPANAGPERTASTPAYWIGNGAADVSIAVLVPEGRDLSAAENYLPALVQGVLVGDFTKFSAMKVLDRQNLEKVIAEGESGYYAEESGFVQLGQVANVRYVLNGALQKTGSGFSLQLKVSEAASGASKAAYTGAVTAVELENLSGVRKASADLLAQLGVSLTDAGKAGLLGAEDSSVIQAETALAKGITAQRSGTVVEALSYYYEAARFDPGLAEAASRRSVLSADIQGGNIGQNVRNDIQRRAAWIKVLDEAAAFFKEHPPFEIIYDPALITGKIDYTKETVEISFKIYLIGTTGLKVIYDLDQGLKKNSRSVDWGVGVDSIFKAIPERYEISAVLVNNDRETIGRSGVIFTPKRDLNFSHAEFTLPFSGVDANKITDKLTVSITSINGMDAKTAGERGYMSVSTEDLAALKIAAYPFEANEWRFGGIAITGYTGTGRNIVIPSKIGRWPLTSIGNRVFSQKNLTSVTIPDSVTSIGSYAFSGNNLRSVTMPDSVTSIGDWAFSKNNLTSVTIPDSVTSIGDSVFRGNDLRSVTIPDSVLSIGSYAFSGNNLRSVTIPDNVTSIGDEAFSYNNNLRSVMIGKSVTSIGESTFETSYGYAPITNVTIPANVQLGGKYYGSDIPHGFDDFYNSNGKKAGTYVYEGRWRIK